MEISVVQFGDSTSRWDLAEKFLKTRKQVFIDRMGWNLVPHKAIECDQYDVISAATYVIAHRGDEILGGARLLRCDSKIGTGQVVYSYMIRDAWRGIIDIPQDICDAAPTESERSWELTRLVVCVPSKKVFRALMSRANRFLWENSAEECLFLGPESFMRTARMFGYCPEPLGKLVSNKDGEFLAFKCAVVPPSEQSDQYQLCAAI